MSPLLIEKDFNIMININSMTSLKKNFSIAKLYSDLEKYEANLTGFKDSRLKRQASGASLHQRPSSTQHKNYDSRESFAFTNLSRF